MLLLMQEGSIRYVPTLPFDISSKDCPYDNKGGVQMDKQTNLSWAILNLLGFAGMVFINVQANTIPIGGRTTGEVSAMFPVLITPASYAFSIWGLIYFLLGIFVILPFFPRWRNLELLKAIGPWFFISCTLNIAWILLWHNLYILSSMAIMINLLVTLIAIYNKIYTYSSDVQPLMGINRLFTILPFSIYLGWISVATIINISIGLTVLEWDQWGFSETFWAVIVLFIAALLAVFFSFKYQDYAYTIVIIWALIAIGVKQTEYPIVSNTAFILAFSLILYIPFHFIRNIRK
jgi:translocator protein